MTRTKTGGRRIPTRLLEKPSQLEDCVDADSDGVHITGSVAE